MNKIRKQKLFLTVNTFAWCLIGAIIWFVLGTRVIDENIYALCFIGYPGFFLGLIGGIIFLYLHDR